MLEDIKKNIGKENITSKLHVSKIELVKDKERESFLLLSEKEGVQIRILMSLSGSPILLF